MYCGFQKKILSRTTFSTLILIINISYASIEHIRMISEGSGDTEDTLVNIRNIDSN